jgi:hypothetical protein
VQHKSPFSFAKIPCAGALPVTTKYGSIYIKCALEEITQISKNLALKVKALYQLRRKFIYQSDNTVWFVLYIVVVSNELTTGPPNDRFYGCIATYLVFCV